MRLNGKDKVFVNGRDLNLRKMWLILEFATVFTKNITQRMLNSLLNICIRVKRDKKSCWELDLLEIIFPLASLTAYP